MMRADECREFADEHGMRMIAIADLIAYVRRTEVQVERVADTGSRLRARPFSAVGYRSIIDDAEHLALVHG